MTRSQTIARDMFARARIIDMKQLADDTADKLRQWEKGNTWPRQLSASKHASYLSPGELFAAKAMLARLVRANRITTDWRLAIASQ
jgi:hypothetical protein